jgi:integrase
VVSGQRGAHPRVNERDRIGSLADDHDVTAAGLRGESADASPAVGARKISQQLGEEGQHDPVWGPSWIATPSMSGVLILFLPPVYPGAPQVRREFLRAIRGATGVNPDEWTPRELRHSFVSLLSDSGIPLEEISRLVGHSSTAVTELVYRKQIRPWAQTRSNSHGPVI